MRILHELSLTLEDFFNLSASDWQTQFSLSEKEIYNLHQALSDLYQKAGALSFAKEEKGEIRLKKK